MSLNLQKCEDNKRCREYTVLSSCLYRFVLVNDKDERQPFSGQLSSYIYSGVNFQMSSLAGMSVRVSLLGLQASHRKWRKFCCSLTFVPHKFLTAEMRFVTTVATSARENLGQLCKFFQYTTQFLNLQMKMIIQSGGLLAKSTVWDNEFENDNDHPNWPAPCKEDGLGQEICK